MSGIVTYNFPTRIRFGAGARHELSETIRSLGATRPVFVTDKGIATLDWFVGLVQAVSADFEVAVFSGIWGNPVGSQVMAGAEVTRGHGADVIIAVGGGAAVDVSKAIAVMHRHDGTIMDFAWGPDMAAIDPAKLPPIIALPSTAGTGSEVGRSAVISDDETHAKKIIFDPGLLPRIVLADPEVTLGLPAHLTAATGFDALTHLIEAFLTHEHHPMCDGIAQEGIRLVARSLETAVECARKQAAGEAVDPERHIAARSDMLDASMMGATAFQKELGVTHSCAHALSTVADTHHGLANAVMLPFAMRFNLEAVPEKFLRLARLVDPESTDGADFITWIEGLRARLGIPAGLKSLGVDRARIDDLIPVAVADMCHQFNPRPVDADDFRAIYSEAFGL